MSTNLVLGSEVLGSGCLGNKHMSHNPWQQGGQRCTECEPPGFRAFNASAYFCAWSLLGKDMAKARNVHVTEHAKMQTFACVCDACMHSEV
eukprot:scaffold262331_cov17-Tisochrysis_lutea.AAC.2